MIELLIGPYRSGKTGHLLKRLVHFKRDNPLDGCLILVPSHRYGRLLSEQLTQVMQSELPERNGLFGVRIATMYEISAQIARDAGLAANVLPRELCATIVGDVLRKLSKAGELRHFDGISRFNGTSHALYSLIDEFERAAMPPHAVKLALDKTAAATSRQYELQKIYDEYWQRLDALRCTDQKRLTLSCRELLAKRHAPPMSMRFLLVDGFDRISPLQAELIEALSQHAIETHIAFDYLLPIQRDPLLDPQDDEYSWKDSSFAELTKRFNVEPTFLALPTEPTVPEQNAFSVLEPFIEAQEVARLCKQAILEKQVAPDQILVVARDVSSYATQIRSAFDAAALPYHIDEAVPVGSLPLTKLCLQLVSLHANNLLRRQVMDVLRSVYFNPVSLGLTAADVDRIDKISTDGCVVEGKEQWQSAFKSDSERKLLEKLTPLFYAVVPPEHCTLATACLWLEDLIDRFVSAHATASSLESTKLREQELGCLSAVRNAVKSILMEESLFDNALYTFNDFASTFASRIDNATFRPRAPKTSHIYVCSAEHAPNRRYDEVFLLGAVEGQFPRHSGSSGFVSTDERARWGTFGVVLSSPREEVGYEKALFKSLIDRARKHFTFSLCQFGASGEEVVPSFYLTDERLVTCKPTPRNGIIDGLRHPTSAREAFATWLWMNPGLGLPLAAETESRLTDFAAFLNRLLVSAYRRQEDGTTSPYNGYLKPLVESGWLEMKQPQAWSASAINNYGQCPFKYWMSNVLRLDRHEEPQSGLNAETKGKLFHHILELFYTKMYAAESETPADHDTILDECLHEAFAELEKKAEFRPGKYWQSEKREIRFRINRFIEFDDKRLAKDGNKWKPFLFEARFGMFEKSFPAVTCSTAYGDVRLRGVIDRIDVERSPDGKIVNAAVIDYKTGSTPISVTDARIGANIQIPVYAMAVQQAILPGTPVQAGSYLGINGAKSNGTLDFSVAGNENILDGAKQHIANAVTGVMTGDFPVNPYSSKACKNCDHHSLCRVSEMDRPVEVTD